MMEESHMVKRAVIMAAGIGKRMQPVTFRTPKPLVLVNGVRMIDTVVQALHENHITEIYVVVGYLKEQFYEWAENQPGVTIIENPLYDQCNNISSLYAARDHLQDAIILDGDQIIYNPTILDPHFGLSGYNAVWTDEPTDEWVMEVKNGVVTSCSRTGGSHGWQLYSISRWSKEDGIRLKRHVEEQFESGNTDLYWDDVVMFCYPEQYTLGIREMKASDIIEIDNLKELAMIDKSYEETAKNAEVQK